jgi:hypothetical protein
VTPFDQVVYDPRHAPYRGWHDDYEHVVPYTPAMQQDRAEFHAFAELVRSRGLCGSCLQLGLGLSGASHLVLQKLFSRVVTIEREASVIGGLIRRVGPVSNIIHGPTIHLKTYVAVRELAPFDVLFVDAGHRLSEVVNDFRHYEGFVRSGGVVALHDAAQQGVDGIEVSEFVAKLREFGQDVDVIGTKLGIAWMDVR